MFRIMYIRNTGLIIYTNNLLQLTLYPHYSERQIFGITQCNVGLF